MPIRWWPGLSSIFPALDHSCELRRQLIITDLGNDTLVNIGGQTITLNGVNGVGANSVSVTDFLLHL